MIRLPNTIETHSGREFDYLHPEVHIEDVAAGLSKVCRFAAQTSRFYSVAEHSVLVARMVLAVDPDLAFLALLHDAHEAYIGDCPTPLKAIIGREQEHIAARIDQAVREAAGLSPSVSFRHPIIKWADEAAMVYEASELMPGPGWDFTRQMNHTEAKDAWFQEDNHLGKPPSTAERLFLIHYESFSAAERLSKHD